MLTPTSKESLNKAGEIFGESQNSPKGGRSRSRDWSERSQLTADACHIHSSLAVAEGLPSEALFHARLSVKNCHRAWAILEHSLRTDTIARNGIGESPKDSVVEAMSGLSIAEAPPAEDISTPYSALQAAAFWTLVPRLFRSLTHISLLFAHHGLIQEARYYLEQSQKVAEAVRAPSLIGQCTALLGQQLIRSGRVDDGSVMLRQAETVLSGLPRDRNSAMLQLFLAAHHAERGEFQAGETAFAIAEKTIQNLMTKSYVDSLIYKLPIVEPLDMQMSGLTLEEPKMTRQPPKKQGRAILKTTTVKPPEPQKPSGPAAGEVPGIEVIALSRTRSEILRGRIASSIRAGRLDVAASLLEAVATHHYVQQDVVPQALVTSQMHLCQGLERLINDPVYCVLPESSISCPSIRTTTARRRPSTAKLPQTGTDTTSSRDKRNKVVAKKPRPRSPSLVKAEADFLRLAQEGMNSVFSLARRVSSTATIHQITDVLARVLIMRSATSSPALNAQVSANRLAHALGKLL